MKRLLLSAFVVLAMLPIILNLVCGGKPIARYRHWSAAVLHQHSSPHQENADAVTVLGK